LIPVVDSLAAEYQARAERDAAQAERYGARSRLVSNLRGLTFGIAVIALLLALFGGAQLVAGVVSGIAALAFAWLVLLHARVIAAEDNALRWAQVNRDALARCLDRWHQLPEDGARFAAAAHPYADDLDLFGPSSLFQKMCVAHTEFGQQTLAHYLKEPADTPTIRLRQEAARALAPLLDLRQRLEALALAVVERPQPAQSSPSVGSDRHPEHPSARASASAARRARQRLVPDPDPLLRWAGSQPRLRARPLVRWGARVLPPVTLGGLVAALLTDLPAAIWALPLLAQLALVVATLPETARVFAAVSSTEGAFLRYGTMLELLEQIDVPAALLQRLRGQILADGNRPSTAMKEFRRMVGWFDLRHNGLVHPFINALLLWDIHCVLGLEAWQLRFGVAARGWFEALGQLEALSSIAGLGHDEPRFVYPELVDAPARFEARELAHPLIARSVRIANDVTLPEPGAVLLVTGSNMSGKSTLLRAMGLAGVMALAGAPVCAAQLRMSRSVVRTSIRIRDSLEHGVSHFYAELGKLKAVLDAAASSGPVLFLLDEILHGTNSRERQIGARWVLSELIARGAMGAATTHDMALTRLPDDLMRRVRLWHFRESVHQGRMTFDYILRPGPVTSGNALQLMRRLGLEVPLE
jgi:hypothetical protein